MCLIFHGLCINTHMNTVILSDLIKSVTSGAAFAHSFNGLHPDSERNRRKVVLYTVYVVKKCNVIFCAHFLIFIHVERIVFYPLRTVRPIYRTGVPLPSKCCILYIFSTNISTEYFKHAAHYLFFFSKCRLFHNATFFGSCIIHILHTGVLKFICKI